MSPLNKVYRHDLTMAPQKYTAGANKRHHRGPSTQDLAALGISRRLATFNLKVPVPSS